MYRTSLQVVGGLNGAIFIILLMELGLFYVIYLHYERISRSVISNLGELFFFFFFPDLLINFCHVSALFISIYGRHEYLFAAASHPSLPRSSCGLRKRSRLVR